MNKTPIFPLMYWIEQLARSELFRVALHRLKLNINTRTSAHLCDLIPRKERPLTQDGFEWIYPLEE